MAKNGKSSKSTDNKAAAKAILAKKATAKAAEKQAKNIEKQVKTAEKQAKVTAEKEPTKKVVSTKTKTTKK